MMFTRIRVTRPFRAVLLLSIISLLSPSAAVWADVLLPEGTTVYLETTKTLIGKKKVTSEGDVVPARVWRDVIVDGITVIKGGTPATAKVASVKNRGIFGIKGKMSIAAIETRTVDGQTVHLTGGYNKEGEGRVGVVVGVGMLLFWPALFVPGDAAKLPSGTVMDGYTMGSTTVALNDESRPTRSIDLGSLMSGFDIEVLYDELTNENKPKNFDFAITVDSDAPEDFVIDVINGSPVEPIAMNTLAVESLDSGEKSIRTNVEIKTLVQQFKKGINTFEVAYNDASGRVSEEVILQIEM